MDVDNEAPVTLPLVIQLAKERLWAFQCGWTLKRSGRTPGGPCKITLNSWHSLRQVSGSYPRVPGAALFQLRRGVVRYAAYVDGSLSLGRNCESQPLNLIFGPLTSVQECKLSGCNLLNKITQDTAELREHILTGHLNNLKLPCPIKGADHYFYPYPSNSLFSI